MPQELLTLSRRDLYELAWSKPIVELAKDFGLSDVALAKRCRKLGIPIPGRGYWARVAAGQTPRQPPLKNREEKWPDQSTLTFDPPREPPEQQEGRPAGTVEEIALREQISVLQPLSGPDHHPASPPVKRTALLLKRPWRSGLTWNRGEKTGPVVRIDASGLVIDRALRLADTFLVGASMLGWTFQTPPEPDSSKSRYRHEHMPQPSGPTYGHLLVQGEALAFRIDERRRQVDHVLTEDEKERKRRNQFVYPPRYDFIPTGELRLHLMHPGWNHSVRTWKDSAKRRLEDQINSILLGFLDDAQATKESRAEQRRAEIESRRREQLRLEQSRRRETNAKLIRQLEMQAGAWMRARLLRSYLRALKRTMWGEKLETIVDEKHVDFLSWAMHYVDQLDPHSATPHDPDLMDEGLQGYRTDEGIRQTLSRLMGRHWQETWKIDGDGAPSEEPKLHADAEIDG